MSCSTVATGTRGYPLLPAASSFAVCDGFATFPPVVDAFSGLIISSPDSSERYMQGSNTFQVKQGKKGANFEKHRTGEI